MEHKVAKQVLKKAIEKGRAVHLWGPPGIGKTSIVRDIAKELKIDIVDVRASQLDPSDVRGIPIPCDGRTKWLIPNWLPTEGKGILFLDEFNLAPPLVQSSFYQLILDRRLGDYKLPEGWVVVCAGNRLEDRSNVFEMSWALANRFIHIYLDVPRIEEWTKWATEHNLDSRIVSFLNFRSELLFKFDTKAKEKAFPTPRSWHFLSELIEGENNVDEVRNLAVSTVGEGCATEFIGFVKLVKKVDVVSLLEGKTEVPREVDIRYAMISAVTDYYKKHKSVECLRKVIKLSDKLEPEFKFLMLRFVARTDGKFFIDNAPKLKEFSKVKELAEFL